MLGPRITSELASYLSLRGHLIRLELASYLFFLFSKSEFGRSGYCPLIEELDHLSFPSRWNVEAPGNWEGYKLEKWKALNRCQNPEIKETFGDIRIKK